VEKITSKPIMVNAFERGVEIREFAG
jgi:hypothetical protein